MADPLWTLDELIVATGGQLKDGPSGDRAVKGVSIDSRTLKQGDLFVALKDQRDGHEFVTSAFEKGAGVALVSSSYEANAADGPLLRVEDPLRALEKIAIAARSRLGDTSRVIAVTGSAGKTTTKEMLAACFKHLGLVHASEKSYNNHWGVPLTLARMPRDTDFAVIEIGMNHAGEIRPLSKMARPHVAVITSVLPVHLEHFSGIEEIARAKAEIFDGLEETGQAVLCRDSDQYELLASLAGEKIGARVMSFGENIHADHMVKEIDLAVHGSKVQLAIGSSRLFSFEVGLPGRHNVLNAAACITACLCALEKGAQKEAVAELDGILKALASIEMEPEGRGQVLELGNEKIGTITLVDESYNANPASMRAALENLSLYPGDRRKVAVIGDMLELGKSADDLHAALVDPIEKAGIDTVFACGPHMKNLYEGLPLPLRGGYADSAGELQRPLIEALQDRDIVMVKGSNGSRLGLLVEALKVELPPRAGVGK